MSDCNSDDNPSDYESGDSHDSRDSQAEVSHAARDRKPPAIETLPRLIKLKKKLNSMTSSELVIMFDRLSTGPVPNTLPAMVGDPGQKMRPDQLAGALLEYGETTLRDAETCFRDQNAHGVYLEYLARGLRPEEASITLLLSMATRLKPTSAVSVAAMLEKRQDRFSKSLSRSLLRLQAVTSGTVSQSVFSMLMEFLQIYLLNDHSKYLRFTDQYKGILDAQRDKKDNGFTTTQFSSVIAAILGEESFESVSIVMLFCALQPIEWMMPVLTKDGRCRLSFAAEKAHSLFYLTVENSTLISPPPHNQCEDDMHPTFNVDPSETLEAKRHRHTLAQENRRKDGNSPRFSFLQRFDLDEASDGYAARQVLRYCVDAWANVLLLAMSQYRNKPFGPTGTSRAEVSNLVRRDRPEDEDADMGCEKQNDYAIACQWILHAPHLLLDLPPTSMFQMSRLLFHPVLLPVLLHLEGEQDPCLTRLPAIACRPHFNCGRLSYNCTFPVTLPMYALKEILNESDFKLIVDLSLERICLSDADREVQTTKMRTHRRQAGLSVDRKPNPDNADKRMQRRR